MKLLLVLSGICVALLSMGARAEARVHKNEFSFLNFILVVTAKRAPISESAMPSLGFQLDGRRSRPKEYPHVT